MRTAYTSFHPIFFFRFYLQSSPFFRSLRAGFSIFLALFFYVCMRRDSRERRTPHTHPWRSGSRAAQLHDNDFLPPAGQFPECCCVSSPTSSSSRFHRSLILVPNLHTILVANHGSALPERRIFGWRAASWRLLRDPSCVCAWCMHSAHLHD